MDWKTWEGVFEIEVLRSCVGSDPAHDLSHFHRVVKTAKRLAAEERAEVDVVIPAAWLHDLVPVPKNDPRRSQASHLSAQAAVRFLQTINFPLPFYDRIAHAIEAHSFSAQVRPLTIEAQVVQDADRLDALGAIGIARVFATAGLLNRPLYRQEDPFCTDRAPDDAHFTVDHFYKKLLVVCETLQTKSGRAEGVRRRDVLVGYLENLRREVQ